MKKNILYALSVISGLGLVGFGENAVGQTPVSGTGLSFIENKGQITDQHGRYRSDIDFKIAGPGLNVFIGDATVHYQWNKMTGPKDIIPMRVNKEKIPLQVETYRMDVTLEGANKNAVLVTEEKNNYYEQYYLAHTPAEGVLAASYRKITYKEVYPAIDWVIYINKDKVEYDFVVHPGGHTSDIRIQYRGAESLKINADGSFIAVTPYGTLTEKAPYSYQEDQKMVASRFVLQEGILGFSTDPYKGKLVIDPTLSWSTYYGGTDMFYDAAYSTVTDKEHNVYISGSTMNTTNMATTGAHQVTFAGETDAYIAKFNSAGVRQWGTYYGGTGSDGAGAGSWYTSLASDTLGNIYLAAATTSTDGIATAGAYQTTNKSGPAVGGDIFIAKFNGSGTRLWGTYYGGVEEESMLQTALASDGANIYLAARTSSLTSIATTGSHQDFYGGGIYDAFLVKFNGEGVRQWATYYGGAEWELEEPGIACDRLGNIYMTGTTASLTGIATAGSHQPVYGGATTWGDAYLVKFNPAGQRQWGTYYGGPGDDFGCGVACDDSLNVYLLGNTNGTSGIASTGAHQTAPGGGDKDAFLAKFNSAGVRQWGTYYGGEDLDRSYGIATGKDGVYISGDTRSIAGIASPGGYQEIYGGTFFPLYGDAFIAAFDHAGKRAWGTYFGGPGPNGALGMAYDPAGYIYICGSTFMDDVIPTPGSHQDTFPGGLLQSFLSKFCLDFSPVLSGADTACAGSEQVYTVAAGVDDVAAYLWELPSGWSGSSTSATMVAKAGTEGGTIKVQVVRCQDTNTISLKVDVLDLQETIITVNGFVLSTVSTYDTYQWLLNDVAIPGAVQATYTVKENGDYRVATAEENGCMDTSDVYKVTNVVSIATPDPAAAIKIYPNPASGARLTVAAPFAVQVGIHSIEGRKMMEWNGTGELDISDLPSGIYRVQVRDRNGVVLKTEKLVRLKP